MPLIDNTAFYNNKENVMTPDKKKGMELEKKMQLPMKSNTEELQKAVSKLAILNRFLSYFLCKKCNNIMFLRLFFGTKKRVWLRA